MVRLVRKFALINLASFLVLCSGTTGCSPKGDVMGAKPISSSRALWLEPLAQSVRKETIPNYYKIPDANRMDVIDTVVFNLPALQTSGKLSIISNHIDPVNLEDFNPGLRVMYDIQKQIGPSKLGITENISDEIDALGIVNWRERFFDGRPYVNMKISSENWKNMRAHISFIEVARLQNDVLVQYIDLAYTGNVGGISVFGLVDGAYVYFQVQLPHKMDEDDFFEYSKQVIAELKIQLEKYETE